MSDIVAVSSLTEALAVLHRAGRIRTPWLVGMHVWIPAMVVGRIGCRYGCNFADDHRWRWDDGRLCEVNPDERWEIDTADPATVGCLAALAREASINPTLMVDCDDARSKARGAPVWHAFSWRAGTPDYPRFDTEGEAWAAVLIAAAERCTAEEGA